MENNFFKDQSAFQNLSPDKLSFLMNFANMKKPTDMKEMAPFLLGAMNSAKKENIKFSPEETNLLIELLKQNMSPEEAAKADKIIKLVNQRNGRSN